MPRLPFFGREKDNVSDAVLRALSASQAIIEFDLTGKVLAANDNFLKLMGYTANEVVGRHHSMFVRPADVASDDYRQFWTEVGGGKFRTGTFKRIAKGGGTVWIEASYNPVMTPDGKPFKVVKLASDVTAKQIEAIDMKSQIAALSRSQAVIEFAMDGTIVTADQDFLGAMGYRLDEVQGRHHSMFMPPDEARSPEYAAFWEALRRGEFRSAEFMRMGKGGRKVWIQATYNPILDADGKPYKVVKFATDVTARKTAVNAIGKALNELAAGKLDIQITGTLPGDLDEVRVSFNRTVERLTHLVGEMRVTSGGLGTTTGQILEGTNDLAERTLRQSSAIQQTSAAVEQLNQAVVENSRRAASASANARVVSDGASEAAVVMGEANGAMQDITQSSAKISSIIGLIDDIAFQTNLLALNASVEAARAGEAGKGFAVVAIEVRRLAQSAAQASSEVKGLIEQSGVAVANGSKLVANASGKLEGMMSRVRENGTLMEGIAQASQDQANAIAEVRTAMRQMDEMTKHNSSLVEETRAAIEQMEGQAAALDGLVEQFDIPGAPVRAAAKTARPKPARRAPAFRSQGNAAVSSDWESF